MFSFFRKSNPARLVEVGVHESNPRLNGQSFYNAAHACTTLSDLYDFCANYGRQTSDEVDIIDELEVELEFNESIALYANTEAVDKATEYCNRVWGVGHPDYDKQYKHFLYQDIQEEVNIRMNVLAAVNESGRQYERSIRQHTELLDTMNEIANNTLYSNTKSVIAKHPFLVGLVGAAAIGRLSNI